MKFQVGDRVVGTGTCGFWNIDGQVGTVRCYCGKDAGFVGVEFDEPCGAHNLHHNTEARCRNNHGLYVRERKLKKIEQPRNAIHITSDGITTVAVLKDGKRTVKRAEAKCAPSDTFDFATGARLAFDRLMGEGKPSGIDWKEFLNGTVLIHVKRESDLPAFYADVRRNFPSIRWHSGERVGDDVCVPSHKFNFHISHGSMGYCDPSIPFVGDDKVKTRVDYVPSSKTEDKPTYREVKRRARVGEWIKVVDAAGWPVEKYKNGEVHKCVSMRPYGLGIDLEVGGCHVAHREYVVLEGYDPKVSK